MEVTQEQRQEVADMGCNGEQTALEPPAPPSGGACTMYLSSTHRQQKLLSTITPVLVLSNNPEKGTVEANVMLDSGQSPALLRLSGQLQNIQAMAQASLIAQTQERIAKQLGGEVVGDKVKDTQEAFVSLENTCHQSARQKTKGKSAGSKVYLCEVEGCGKTFSSSGVRKFHQTTQGHSGSSKALECPYHQCGRKFARPAHFKYHQLTHTDDRHYACLVAGCEKRFFTAQHLTVHMRTHTGEKPFVCQEFGCGKSFTTAGNLKNHKRIHSGERPFACDHEGCGRKFAECSSLKKHKLVHTGEKPFTCEICCKTFSQSGSRKVHMKRHEMAAAAAAVTIKRERKEDVKEDAENQDYIVIQGEIPQYQDDSVVFSQGLTDHVVTVTTQPADGDTELPQNMLETEGLGCDSIQPEVLPSASKSVNVVVLSQPQEIVGLTSPYHQTHIPGREEIIYESDPLHTALDHEEIAHSEFSLQSLTQGSQSAADIGVEDGIMAANQALTEHGDISSSSQAGREMVMDPMMESDEENDHVEDMANKQNSGKV